jgi:uncharacterized protein YpuA (DUF1002 family)
MAKASAKTVSAPVKKSVAKPKAKTSASIEKVSEEVLEKLKSLDLEQQLQADIEWCLGSYRYDQNATGLIEVIGKAHDVLKEAHAKKTKGITATLLTNIEKVLN